VKYDSWGYWRSILDRIKWPQISERKQILNDLSYILVAKLVITILEICSASYFRNPFQSFLEASWNFF
jgi:hypothetical protein